MTDALASPMHDYVQSPMRDRMASAVNVVVPLPCGCLCRCKPDPDVPFSNAFIHVHGTLNYEPCCWMRSTVNPGTWPKAMTQPGPIDVQVRPGFEPYQEVGQWVWAGNVGANEDAPGFVPSTPECGWQPRFWDLLPVKNHDNNDGPCVGGIFSEGFYWLQTEGRCGSDGAWLVMSTNNFFGSAGPHSPVFVGRYSGDLCASTVVIAHAYEGDCPAPQPGVFQGRLIAGAVLVLHTTCAE